MQALNYSLGLDKSGDQGQSKVANPMKVEAPATTKFTVHELSAWFGSKQVLHSLNLEINAQQVTAIIGPSGCGKSTFIRCLNRMHELVPAASIKGEVRLDEENIYGSDVDPLVHVALVKGDISGADPVLVRMHAYNLFDDTLAAKWGQGDVLGESMRMIGAEGRGGRRADPPQSHRARLRSARGLGANDGG